MSDIEQELKDAEQYMRECLEDLVRPGRDDGDRHFAAIEAVCAIQRLVRVTVASKLAGETL